MTDKIILHENFIENDTLFNTTKKFANLAYTLGINVVINNSKPAFDLLIKEPLCSSKHFKYLNK